MCGIAAILKSRDIHFPTAMFERMRDEVSYRGPDDKGRTFFNRSGSAYHKMEMPDADSAWEIGLGHRRLSILDLSSAGHQPMGYKGRFWIVYNGEVYNYIELRAELQGLGHLFHSASDTEVILAAYAEWGPACFDRLRGMWAIVILDCVRSEIIVCRDRLGIKPLYLWEGSGLVAIASEIKQLLHVPGFTARMDPVSAALYLQTGYENSSRSFFRDVWPVPAGCWLRVSLDSLKLSEPEAYWHPERIQVGVTNADEAGRLFADKLRETVRMHLRSDVPVGCALSGGLDSSSIAVLVNAMKNGQGVPLHTFTSTFPGHRYDERQFVDSVVATIRALPHFTTPDPHLFLEELDRFLWIHDEPVGSLSMYAGYCVARLTQEAGIPVTLNGQGGDEILSGYWQTYFLHLLDLWKQGQLMDLSRHFLGALMRNGNPVLMGQVPVMLRRFRARGMKAFRPRLRNIVAINTQELLQEVLGMDNQARRVHEIRDMFLPRLLKWDDRNSMAFSVEGRYPFLDHHLIELCLSFAPRTLYRKGWTKYPLRLGLQTVLPSEICHRRSKYGFETPQDDWLCGPLRLELECLFEKDRPVWDYVEREDLRQLSQQVWELNGKHDEPGQALFRVFIFDRWLKIFGVQS